MDKQQIRSMDDELNSLLQVTQAINSNISFGGLLKMYENILVKHTGAGRMAVFINQDNWNCAGTYGIELIKAAELVKESLLTFKQLTKINSSHPLAGYFNIVIPVYHKQLPLSFTFLGGFSADDQSMLDEKLNYLQTISNVVAVGIENKRLYRAHLNQRVIKSELEMAGQMQTMLIPNNLPDDDRISLSGIYLPHQEVGGDYYDYIRLNNEESLFCIGDISGKGMAAALLMANFQASVRSYTEQQPSIQAVIEALNTRVNEITNGEKYITVFLAKFNFSTRELQYVNAGHNPPLLYHQGEMKMLQEGCTILGMFDKLPYVNVQSITLPDEFIVFCYTDGLIDVENEKKQMLQIADIISFIEKDHSLTPSKLNKKIVDHLIAFKGSRRINDDISILTCKVYGAVKSH